MAGMFFSIPIIAMVPFAISIWAVRKAAPSDLVRAGAVAGLIAGGVSAMAYALHCTNDSLPLVAVCTAARLCCAPSQVQHSGCDCCGGDGACASRQREPVTAKRFAPNSLLEAQKTRLQQ